MFYSIGQLSQATTCPIETIRYYEKIGLLPKAERTMGNQRRYNNTHHKQLLFILHARGFGFSIQSIRQLLSFYDKPDANCHAVDDIAREQLQAVRQKIVTLKRLEKELEKMVSTCHADKIEKCHIMESLEACSQCQALHAG